MTVDDIVKIDNEKKLLSDDVMNEVFEEANEVSRAKLIIALRDKAMALRCANKFDMIINAWKKMEKDIEKSKKEAQKTQPPPNDNFTAFGYFDDGHELACGAWVADQNGICGYDMFGKHIACYHPILITKTLMNNETGNEKVRIAFRKGSWTWREITVDKGVIASASKIVSLADKGISVTTESAKLLVRYLSDLENLNMYSIDRGISTSKFGWIGDDFMPYDKNIEFDAYEQFRELCESLEPHGDYQKWKDLVLEVRKSGRYEPRLYMAGAFASILLKPLNILPFILNIYGASGGGKTVSIMIATSIWASPSTEHSYMADPTDTMTGFERKENTLNHLPLVLDDLSKTRDKYADGFTDLVYMICSGRGKGRSNVNLGLNKIATWQNVCLTNIERPLATETMRGGAINRILDFEMDEGGIFKNGNRVVSIINKNYGWAGEDFVRTIKNMDVNEIKEIYQRFLTKIREEAAVSGDEKEEKQEIPLAILLTADKIATDTIFEDGIYLDLKKCVGQLKSKKDVSENERAYEFILSEVAVNANRFLPDDDGNYKGECWGRIDDGYLVIISNAFDKIAEKGNFSKKLFLQWAQKHNLIQCDKNGKTTKVCRFDSGSVRCVYLKMLNDDEDYGWMTISADLLKDLPFN